MRQILLILISFILINCQGFHGNQSSNDSVANKDTLHSSFFKEVIAEDSIKILEFKKFTQDTFKQERIVYIDYKYNNKDRKRVLTDKIENHKAEFRDDSKDSSNTKFVSRINELNNTYVSLRKYEKDYCLYYFDISFSKTISDTAIIFNDMDGYTVIGFKNVQKSNGNIVFDLVGNSVQMKLIEVKVIDPKLNVQIWRTQMNIQGMEPQSSFEMVIPSKLISKIPILYTLTSDQVDQSFDKFDEIDLENMFKK